MVQGKPLGPQGGNSLSGQRYRGSSGYGVSIRLIIREISDEFAQTLIGCT